MMIPGLIATITEGSDPPFDESCPVVTLLISPACFTLVISCCDVFDMACPLHIHMGKQQKYKHFEVILIHSLPNIAYPAFAFTTS